MNAFPEVLPDNFAYDLGGLNVSAEDTQNGAPVLFRHSLRQSNYRLTLTYNNLIESDVTLIRQHYIEAAGSHRSEEQQRGIYTDMTVELVALIGNFLLYDLIGEPATLGAEESFTSYAMTGTAPFILDGDAADPAEDATLIIKAGGAES